jgi:hypothetical protein
MCAYLRLTVIMRITHAACLNAWLISRQVPAHRFTLTQGYLKTTERCFFKSQRTLYYFILTARGLTWYHDSDTALSKRGREPVTPHWSICQCAEEGTQAYGLGFQIWLESSGDSRCLALYAGRTHIRTDTHTD